MLRPSKVGGLFLKILIIIPAFNEQESIVRVVTELKADCPEADYIVVNDCSRDNTETICEKNGIDHLNLKINLGIGGAVQTGYKYALQKGYDIAVQLDGDGQHDPKFLKDLIRPIEEGRADMVTGSRFIEKAGFQSSCTRRLGITILRTLIKFGCGVKITDATSGFRACNKKLIAFFAHNYAQDYPEPEAIIGAVKNGFRVAEIPVVMRSRDSGKSSISAIKSVYYMIKVSLSIIIYSVKIH